MENNPEFAFTLLTLASAISKVKKDNDTESWLYSDWTLKHFNQAKGYTQSHAVEIVNRIISCFDECFLSVHEENDTSVLALPQKKDRKSYSIFVKFLTVLFGPHCKLKMMKKLFFASSFRR